MILGKEILARDINLEVSRELIIETRGMDVESLLLMRTGPRGKPWQAGTAGE